MATKAIRPTWGAGPVARLPPGITKDSGYLRTVRTGRHGVPGHAAVTRRHHHQQAPTAIGRANIAQSAFWFWSKERDNHTEATKASAYAAEAVSPDKPVEARRNSEISDPGVSPSHALRNDDWQKLHNVPHGSGTFEASRWHVKRKLGQGSYGIVYSTEDLEDNCTRRAVKVLSKTRKKVDPSKVKWKLENEIQLLACVQSSPNAVRFHEVLEDNERTYLVMDMCKGGTLSDLLEQRGGALLEAEAALAMFDVLTFLKSCHDHQICYADAKPANFMFMEPYEGLEELSSATGGLGLKAIDMGCSKVVREGTRLTKRMGTPAYFAPEVFLRSYDIKADLWSVGVLAYQLLTGRFPYWESLTSLTTQDVMDCVVHKKVPYEEEHWGKLSPEAHSFTTSLLKREANKRMTAEEALQHPFIVQNLARHRPDSL